jgi:hypothetical protein
MQNGEEWVQTVEAVTSPLPIEDNTKSKPLNTNVNQTKSGDTQSQDRLRGPIRGPRVRLKSRAGGVASTLDYSGHPTHSILAATHSVEFAERWGRRVRNDIEDSHCSRDLGIHSESENHEPALGLRLGTTSASGRKQTSISTLNMSAFGGKADIADRLANVCF